MVRDCIVVFPAQSSFRYSPVLVSFSGGGIFGFVCSRHDKTMFAVIEIHAKKRRMIHAKNLVIREHAASDKKDYV